MVQRVARMADEGMTLSSIRRIIELEAEVARLRNLVAELRGSPS
jgi:hypothetical protein